MKFQVEDMSCGHCTAAIEKAVAEAGGRAITDLASHSVTVEGLDEARAAQVIRDAASAPAAPEEAETMDEGAPVAPTEGSTEQVEEYGTEREGDATE